MCTRWIFFIIFFFSLINVSSAGVDFQSLSPIKSELAFPNDVATGRGKIYVSDARKETVNIYDSDTGRLQKIIKVKRPTSVAIGPGFSYIGTNDNFHVKVLNKDDEIINYIGYKKFEQPRNIAIDALSGDVYVLDDQKEKIFVYPSYGERLLREIDINGTLPVDLCITGGFLYVLEQPKVGTIRGAQITVRDLDGTVRKTFNIFGSTGDRINKPWGIFVDSKGTIYVTGSFHGVVQCYSNGNGNYLGTIFDPSSKMQIPKGLAIDDQNRLFVTSPIKDQVKVFNLATPIPVGKRMDVSPLGLSFNNVEVGEEFVQTVIVKNVGTIPFYILESRIEISSEFYIKSESCSVSSIWSMGDCKILVGTKPTSLGQKVAKLMIKNDFDENEVGVVLSMNVWVPPPPVEIIIKDQNSKSRGRWFPVYIELPDDRKIEEINIISLRLIEINGLEVSSQKRVGPSEIGDINKNGVSDLMVRFDKKNLLDSIIIGTNWVTVTGTLFDGSIFFQEGSFESK